jgi:hypothetical protein
MEIEKIKTILGLGGMFVVSVLTIRIIRRDTAEIKRAKIQEPDGSLREPTTAERMAIANYLAFRKGKYFWLSIIILVIILAVLVILAVTGILPKLIETAAKIYAKYLAS